MSRHQLVGQAEVALSKALLEIVDAATRWPSFDQQARWAVSRPWRSLRYFISRRDTASSGFGCILCLDLCWSHRHRDAAWCSCPGDQIPNYSQLLPFWLVKCLCDNRGLWECEIVLLSCVPIMRRFCVFIVSRSDVYMFVSVCVWCRVVCVRRRCVWWLSCVTFET